jgi:Zn-dependent metalloprotease
MRVILRAFAANKVVLLAVILATLVLVHVTTTSRTEAQSPESEEQLLRQLDDRGARVYRHAQTGKVRLIGTTKEHAISRPTALAASASPEAAARAYIAEYGKLFGIEDQTRQLRAEGAEEAGKDRSVVRFQQVHGNVPVLGGELNVQVDGANRLLVATGEVLPHISLDTQPGVGAQEAKRTALEYIAKQYEEQPNGLRATEPKLWVFDPTLLGGPGLRVPKLVWRMDVTPVGQLDEFRELVLVDADVGNVALNFDQVDNARERRTHTTNSTSALPGTLLCTETTNPCAPSNTDAKLAHTYAGDTYDFYKSKHNRDSLDNAGMPLISTVDYCPGPAECPFQNAFWNGQQMVYGDGYSAADDVVGHELTHGVTDHESRLFYYYQSGAINESFSDVWGEFIDLTNGSGNDTAGVRWKMGEDIPVIGAIRNIKNPPAFGDPDRMRSPNYTTDLGESDNGGVHTNSGVNNKAAFLMTDGGTFNGRTITKLGSTSEASITKVAKIYYEVQTNLLTSASDYQDLQANLTQGCSNLIGTAGITAANCREVKDATLATQMNLTPTAAPNREAPICAAGKTKTNLFFDDLENPASGNWSKQANWYYPQNRNPFDFDATYATSGKYNMWGYDPASRSDHSITKVRGVNVPAGKTAYLRFNHAYGFDDGSGPTFHDGGVLEYSTNNGTTWVDAGPLIVNNGYKGDISNSSGNPLKGRRAFVGESNGYISSRVDLSSLAGQDVKIRFRIGSDSARDDYGWFVDDINFYTCS